MNNLEEQVKQWVISADKYHYLLESEEEYIAKEITKICIEFTKDFTEWRDNHSWEHDYREQQTHTLDEQIEIFTK